MFLELNRDELAMLVRLVEERVHKEREMGCEERASEHPATAAERDEDCWCRILHKLHECECDVFA
jgi:hypothetical protein